MKITDEMMMAAASATGHTIHPEDLRKALEAALSAPAGVVKPQPLSDKLRYEAADEIDNLSARIMSAIETAAPQCCMCGKKGLSTVEGDGGTECELPDGRWVCSAECWERAVEPAGVGVETREQKLEDALRNLLGVYDTPLSRRRFPQDDFMKEAIDTARAALKGDEQ